MLRLNTDILPSQKWPGNDVKLPGSASEGIRQLLGSMEWWQGFGQRSPGIRAAAMSLCHSISTTEITYRVSITGDRIWQILISLPLKSRSNRRSIVKFKVRGNDLEWLGLAKEVQRKDRIGLSCHFGSQSLRQNQNGIQTQAQVLCRAGCLTSSPAVVSEGSRLYKSMEATPEMEPC